jgi:hypothetical protein
MGEYIPVAPINDEARRRNGNLPGMGGVFNYVNLHVYHYAGNNPVKYTDPDGRDDEDNINIFKEFGDILSINIKMGLGFDLSFISDVNVDLLSMQGTFSSEGYKSEATIGVGSWIVGYEKTAPNIQNLSAFDSLRYYGKQEGNIGPLRFGENGLDFVFSFGGQAIIGLKLNISSKEILDFVGKIFDKTHGSK